LGKCCNLLEPRLRTACADVRGVMLPEGAGALCILGDFLWKVLDCIDLGAAALINFTSSWEPSRNIGYWF